MGSLDMNMKMNMNMNMNMAAPGTSMGGQGTSVRFNTQDFRKYVQLNPVNITEPIIPVTTANMRFFAYWDADLRAYEYLNEFLIAFPGWRTTLTTFATGQPWDLVPPHMLSSAALTLEVHKMLDLAPDREDRFAEIIDQHNAEGSIGYFLGMLAIDPHRMPATNLLIRVARRIGEHIVMCLKGEFRCPRPSQLCSAIVPMIDPPATPSFPAGHSLQARLIAECLKVATPPMKPPHLIDDLAARIGENRIIAGLHFPKDNLVGREVGAWCVTQLQQLPPAPGNTVSRFQKLLTAATTELTNVWAAQP